MSEPRRIALVQLSCESNHFISTLSGMDHFRDTGFFYRGDEIFKLRGTENELAGMMDELESNGECIVPLIATRGNSTGLITRSFFDQFKADLIIDLKKSMPIDGILLSCHGSMVIEDEDDPEGELAAALRAEVGVELPIIMTLDLHANVTERMTAHLTAIIGYHEYPHDDTYQVGVRAASLLHRVLRRAARPQMGFCKLPMLLTAFNASTKGNGPFAQLMSQARQVERDREVLSVSLFFVGSYIDVQEIGCSVVVVTDNNPDRAQELADDLGEAFWSARDAFDVKAISVAEAVERGRKIAGGPILLLDTADTTGGGAAGDGIGLVRELIRLGVSETCYATVVDPVAAHKCVNAGVGQELTIDVGHLFDRRWGSPMALTGRVQKLSDGALTYSGGILGGQRVTMGPTVVFQHGSISLVIMSKAIYDWSDEKLRIVGLDPRDAKFIGVKNMMNFRYGYADVMKSFFVVDIPGPTPCDMRQLKFNRIPRPIYPFDEVIPDPFRNELATR